MAYAENFHGEVIQWHMVGAVCDVTIGRHIHVYNPNQRFDKVYWHNMRHALFYVSLHLIYTISAPSKDNGGKYTQRYDTAVQNCKISGCVLKQGSKTHSSRRQSNLQLKNQAARMSSRIRSRAQVCGRNGLRKLWVASSNLAEQHKNWECA